MRGWQRRGPPPLPPPCLHFLRGSCRFGDACRFLHSAPEQLPEVLPFHHRRMVAGEACAAAAQHGSAAQGTPPPGAWHLRAMSYNVLADHLAHDHAGELYNSRATGQCRRGAQWGSCSWGTVEVDHFAQLEAALHGVGYEGVYVKRTGDRRDGLATFWRVGVLRPLKQQAIKFSRLGMKDNVAQLLVLRRMEGGQQESGGGTSSSSSGSEGSLSGQKRSRGSSPQHLRFADEGEESSVSMGEVEVAVVRTAPGGGVAQGQAKAETEAEDAIPMQAEGPAAVGAAARRRGGQRARCGAAEERSDAEAGGGAGWRQARAQQQLVVVANIHVLFNPKRGDIKLGQVRTLLEEVHKLGRRYSAPAVICGDFNSAAGRHGTNMMPGPVHASPWAPFSHLQVQSSQRNWHSLRQDFLWLQEQQAAVQRAAVQQAAAAAGLVANGGPSSTFSATALQMAAVPVPAASSNGAAAPGVHLGAYSASVLEALMVQQLTVVPPYAPPTPPPALAAHTSPGSAYQAQATGQPHGAMQRSGKGGQRAWSSDDLLLAQGPSSSGRSGDSTPSSSRGGSGMVAAHPLQVCSAYAAVTGSEPPFTTCHDKFIGTVDYIWFTPHSPGSSGDWSMRPLGVLLPPPVQTLRCGLPNHQWPSDHVCLVADFELSSRLEQQQAGASCHEQQAQPQD
eukprot:scaffold5.g1011.t1